MATSKIITGARSIFKLNGKKVAFATGVTVNQTINFEPFRPLDSVFVVENVEVSYDCSLAADEVTVIGQSPTQQGLWPAMNQLAILTESEMTAEIYDALSGQLVLNVVGVKCNTNNRQFRANQIVANDLTFVARIVNDVTDANPQVINTGSPTGTNSGQPGI
jgi:hypothetical protein